MKSQSTFIVHGSLGLHAVSLVDANTYSQRTCTEFRHQRNFYSRKRRLMQQTDTLDHVMSPWDSRQQTDDSKHKYRLLPSPNSSFFFHTQPTLHTSLPPRVSHHHPPNQASNLLIMPCYIVPYIREPLLPPLPSSSPAVLPPPLGADSFGGRRCP